MKQTFRCGDQEALIGYLYDECEPGERQAVAAHLALCASCADEFTALSGTREQLSAWTPPQVSLGFHMGDERRSASTAWWHHPLPAWAQLAAAAVIFSAGLAVGAWRTVEASDTGAVTTGVSAQAEITRLEQRLRDLETRQNASLPVNAADHAAAHDEILQVVKRELHRLDVKWDARLFDAVDAGAQDTQQVWNEIRNQAAGIQPATYLGFGRNANGD